MTDASRPRKGFSTAQEAIADMMLTNGDFSGLFALSKAAPHEESEGEKASRQFGENVGAFYQAMRGKKVPEELAAILCQQFVVGFVHNMGHGDE